MGVFAKVPPGAMDQMTQAGANPGKALRLLPKSAHTLAMPAVGAANTDCPTQACSGDGAGLPVRQLACKDTLLAYHVQSAMTVDQIRKNSTAALWFSK